jgi:hypothetical protein
MPHKAANFCPDAVCGSLQIHLAFDRVGADALKRQDISRKLNPTRFFARYAVDDGGM